jgi:tetratricopeptide (TPR) repeat protein
MGAGGANPAHHRADPVRNAEEGLLSLPPEQARPASSRIDIEIANLEKETERRPGNVTAWVRLGDAFMQKSRETMDRRIYARAEAAYTKALALDPEHTGAMVGLAWVNNSRHLFDQGIQWAEKALKRNPSIQQAHALLGDAAVELGDYDRAFEHYQATLDLRPDLSSYSPAAHLLWITGDATRARRLMRKAIDAGGPYAENAAWCRAQLALMLFQGGAMAAAEREVERAQGASPNRPFILAAAARIKAARGRVDEAIGLYRRAVKIRPTHDALVGLGDLLALVGRRDEAEDVYERLVDMHTRGEHGHSQDPQEGHSHGNVQLARFYADHDRSLEEALREVESAYETYKNVFVADTLAWCYHKKGLHEKAVRAMQEALRWKTQDPSFFFHAGMIHAEAGDRATARIYLYRALSLNPRFHPLDATVAAETLEGLAGETV